MRTWSYWIVGSLLVVALSVSGCDFLGSDKGSGDQGGGGGDDQAALALPTWPHAA